MIAIIVIMIYTAAVAIILRFLAVCTRGDRDE